LPWQMFSWVVKVNFKHDIWSICTCFLECLKY
jgi:hypothetical protein